MSRRSTWQAFGVLCWCVYFGSINHQVVDLFGEHKALARFMYLAGLWGAIWILRCTLLRRLWTLPATLAALGLGVVPFFSAGDVWFALGGLAINLVLLNAWLQALYDQGADSLLGPSIEDDQLSTPATLVVARCGCWGAGIGTTIFASARIKGIAGPPDGALDDALSWVLGGVPAAGAVLIGLVMFRAIYVVASD